MDVLTMIPTDVDYGLKYKADKVVENITSIIWTERYQDFGEFELKTSDVERIRLLLPEYSFITLQDSRELMLVETHSIKPDSNDVLELTIKGRSLTSLLERRLTIGPKDGKELGLPKLYTDRDAALLYLWDATQNNSSYDVAQSGVFYSKYPNLVPGSYVTDSTTKDPGTPKSQWVKLGTSWEQIKRFLELGDYGIRMIRSGSKVPSYMVSTTTADDAYKGNISRTYMETFVQSQWNLYHGVDRSITQSTYPVIAFNIGAEQLTDPEYLFSIKDYRTSAMMVQESQPNQLDAYRWTDHPSRSASGWQRSYVLYQIEGLPSEPENDGPYDIIHRMAFKEIEKYPKIRLFDGDVSPLADYKYNRDYFLGDYVTIEADYGITHRAQISEYVRTQDANGEKGYPGLTVVA